MKKIYAGFLLLVVFFLGFHLGTLRERQVVAEVGSTVGRDREVIKSLPHFEKEPLSPDEKGPPLLELPLQECPTPAYADVDVDIVLGRGEEFILDSFVVVSWSGRTIFVKGFGKPLRFAPGDEALIQGKKFVFLPLEGCGLGIKEIPLLPSPNPRPLYKGDQA